jgi:hypothetical protein
VLYASSGNWTVKIDGVTLPPSNFTVTENSEYAFIYFDYPHSQHSIEITGTTIVPEFQPNLLAPLLAAITLATLLITVRKRRKLNLENKRHQPSSQQNPLLYSASAKLTKDCQSVPA